MPRGIYDIYEDYLSGKKIDVARRFHDVSTRGIVERVSYLRLQCQGKKVLHIGCLDHPEIILRRVENGTWLHGVISDVSEVCLGLDVNRTGYEYARAELHTKNVELLDLTKPLGDGERRRLREIDWDLILCPEILEHVTNHQILLENINEIARSHTILVVTVPNAFRFANFVNTLRQFEEINSDHSYWFSFYTLSHTLAVNGWKPCRLIYYDNPKEKLWFQTLCRVATKMSRAFSDGLIVEAVPFR